MVQWLEQNSPSDIAQVRITELTDQRKKLWNFMTEQSESQGAGSLINIDKLPIAS